MGLAHHPPGPLRLAGADHIGQLAAIGRTRAGAGGRPLLVVLGLRSAQHPADLHGEARRGHGEDDARLQYSIEWCFFTRCQWGEFDTALYELERAWGRSPEFATPIGGGQRPPTDRTIPSLDDVHTAVAHYVDNIPYDLVLSTAAGISTDIDFHPVSDAEMAAALARRAHAGPAERDTYASYINEAFLTALEKHADHIVYQYSLGAEPLPYETGSRLTQRTIGQLAEMMARHRNYASSVSFPAVMPISRFAPWRGNCPISASPVFGGTTSSQTLSGRSSQSDWTCSRSTSR